MDMINRINFEMAQDLHKIDGEIVAQMPTIVECT